MAERGWVAISRGLLDDPDFKDEPFTEREAWQWLISEAAFEPRRYRVGRIPFDLQRGQLVHSLRFMADRFKWHVSKVRRFIEQLRRQGKIDTRPTHDATVITICKFDKWQQSRHDDETQTDELPTHSRHRKEQLNKDDDGGSAPNAFEIATELLKICGHSPDFWPPGWCGSPQWVQKCLNEGWLPEIMIAETRAVVGRKRDGPIENFIYLEKPLARAHARHLAPLPKVETPKQEVIDGSYSPPRRRSILDAIDALPDAGSQAVSQDTVLGLPKG